MQRGVPGTERDSIARSGRTELGPSFGGTDHQHISVALATNKDEDIHFMEQPSRHIRPSSNNHIEKPGDNYSQDRL